MSTDETSQLPWSGDDVRAISKRFISEHPEGTWFHDYLAEAINAAHADLTTRLAAAEAERDAARAQVERVEALATSWAAKCDEDDWPESGDLSEAFIADAGRVILRALATPAPESSGAAND